jgi:hypothetical protein
MKERVTSFSRSTLLLCVNWLKLIIITLLNKPQSDVIAFETTYLSEVIIYQIACTSCKDARNQPHSSRKQFLIHVNGKN